MHVLLASDRFSSPSLSCEVAAASARGWADGAPHDTLDLCPLSDGGPGFVDLLADRLGARSRLLAPGVLLVDGAERRTVYVDSSVGLSHGPGSSGVGEQLRLALAAEPARVVVGLGTPDDTPVVPDGGAGLLTALGVGGLSGAPGDCPGGRADDLAGLGALIEACASVDLVGACATDIGLLGLHGASAGAAQAGALSSEAAQELERSLGDLSHAVWSWTRTHAAVRLLRSLPLAEADGSTSATGRARDLTGLPGAGAGAGLGWVLVLLGGRLLPGAALWADLVDLPEQVSGADLVVSVVDDLSSATFHGSGAEQAAAAASQVGVPCVVLAWTSIMNRREHAGSGISALYVAASEGCEVEPGALGELARRVSRSWSPARTAAQGS